MTKLVAIKGAKRKNLRTWEQAIKYQNRGWKIEVVR